MGATWAALSAAWEGTRISHVAVVGPVAASRPGRQGPVRDLRAAGAGHLPPGRQDSGMARPAPEAVDVMDPVEAAADAIRREQDIASPETLARLALTAMHDAGWRIVRTEAAGCYDLPPGWVPDIDDPLADEWDRSGVFYEDEDRPKDCVPLYRITEEWER